MGGRVVKESKPLGHMSHGQNSIYKCSSPLTRIVYNFNLGPLQGILTIAQNRAQSRRSLTNSQANEPEAPVLPEAWTRSIVSAYSNTCA